MKEKFQNLLQIKEKKVKKFQAVRRIQHDQHQYQLFQNLIALMMILHHLLLLIHHLSLPITVIVTTLVQILINHNPKSSKNLLFINLKR